MHWKHGRGREGRGEREFGGGGHWSEMRRMRRGDIRTVLLAALLDGPAHGYELSSRLEQKSGGVWRPSPGSVYPTLQLLEDEGMVVSEMRDGKRVYQLTDAGRAEAATRAERGGAAPWEDTARPGASAHTMRESLMQLHMAAKQVAFAGNAEQTERAVEILAEARRKLYELLAKS